MNHLLRLAALMLLCVFTACSTSQYQIKGYTPSAAPLELSRVGDGSQEPIDSVSPRHNLFRFKGKAGEPHIYLLSTLSASDKLTVAQFFVIEQGRINVHIDSTGAMQFGGTPLNDKLQAYRNQRNALHGEWKRRFLAYNAKLPKGRPTSREDLIPLRTESDSLDMLEADLLKLDLRYARENINNVTGQLAVDFIMLMEPSVEQLKTIVAEADSASLQSYAVRQISKRIAASELIGEGKPFLDFSAVNTKARSVQLSDYAGKGSYTLMYIWSTANSASANFAGLTRLYQRFHDKGFEIVGVSLDYDRQEWLDYLTTQNTGWPQLIAPKSWQGQPATLYDIRRVPYTVLIAPDGKIVVKEQTAAELEQTLEALLE